MSGTPSGRAFLLCWDSNTRTRSMRESSTAGFTADVRSSQAQIWALFVLPPIPIWCKSDQVSSFLSYNAHVLSRSREHPSTIQWAPPSSSFLLHPPPSSSLRVMLQLLSFRQPHAHFGNALRGKPAASQRICSIRAPWSFLLELNSKCSFKNAPAFLCG